jgi:hypothetical protein
MSIVNTRNAIIGWATLSVGKRLAKKKAKGVLPSRDGGSTGKKKALKAVAVVVTVAGAAAFWKARHRDSTDHDSIASEEIGTSAPEE